MKQPLIRLIMPLLLILKLNDYWHDYVRTHTQSDHDYTRMNDDALHDGDHNCGVRCDGGDVHVHNIYGVHGDKNILFRDAHAYVYNSFYPSNTCSFPTDKILATCSSINE